MPVLKSGPEPSMGDIFLRTGHGTTCSSWAGLVGDVSREIALRPASCNLPHLIFLLIRYGFLEVLRCRNVRDHHKVRPSG